MVPIGLVYSIHDSTEVAINKMIEASQRMLDVQSQVGGEPKDGWGLNIVMKKHLELEIRTLQNAPRDADKLRQLLKVKQRQKDEADHIEDTQRLVTEIEMLKVVLCLVSRKPQQQQKQQQRNSPMIGVVFMILFSHVPELALFFFFFLILLQNIPSPVVLKML